FGKGLAFDTIEGRFHIENGNAYTNNLAMTGPSVDINISGRTGLVDHDYDQIATVTPQITDSLPLASALFGPIGIGVGAVIFLASGIFKSLPDKIDTLLRKQYTITGAWDEPQVTKINKEEEEKEKG
ncbi:MAG: AsmA-like C-terminal region-containing protein, partial [Gammaproteobacteria bacterium]